MQIQLFKCVSIATSSSTVPNSCNALLLDQGAQHNFLSFNLALQIKIQPHHFRYPENSPISILETFKNHILQFQDFES